VESNGKVKSKILPSAFKSLPILLGMGLLALPLVLYGWLHFLRPPREPYTQALFQGITYQRKIRVLPRPAVIHIVAIDLSTPGVKALVTPSSPSTTDMQTTARTTSAFLQEFKLQLAVNASFFYPFKEKTPWDYYPRAGEGAKVLGQSISNQQRYAPPRQGWAALCFLAHRAQVFPNGECPPGTIHAVAGIVVLVESGQPAYHNFDAKADRRPYSRVAAAIDKTGQKLWLVLVDGKQPLYSEGATIFELAEIMADLGVDTAINLDGGGSTTLVIDTPAGAKVLNAPMHTKLPMRERPVANHLGFYASPQK
jgi:hypothetical protein